MTECGVCGNAMANNQFVAREMMFGLKDEFTYLECSHCGCLQLIDIPADFARYYPILYYSFGTEGRSPSGLKRWLKHKRARYSLGKGGAVGKLLTMLYGKTDYGDWFRELGVDFDSRILDVGCGRGHLLFSLRNDGFRNLKGIDPFVKEDIVEEGVTVSKKNLFELDGEFDLIMMHHSFEHMLQPKRVLIEICRLLLPGGRVIVRTPVASSYAWRHYGPNWVQLDAPRHVFVHTEKSISILAEGVGFRIVGVQYDSTELQFVGSEQYCNRIALTAPSSYFVDPSLSIFCKEDIRRFKREARALNLRREGDSACFYLQKP